MKAAQRKKLEGAGWRVGDAKDFLELSPAEAEMVEIKLSLADRLRKRRRDRRLTQTQVARLLESSQSRVAKMEAADASVTVDLLVRSLLTMGATRREIARLIAP